MKAAKSDTDKREIIRIRVKLGRSTGGYGRIIEGVHTWDVAEIFQDMRVAVKIATAALERAAEAQK